MSLDIMLLDKEHNAIETYTDSYSNFDLSDLYDKELTLKSEVEKIKYKKDLDFTPDVIEWMEKNLSDFKSKFVEGKHKIIFW